MAATSTPKHVLYQPEKMAEAIANYLAGRSRGLTRKEIVAGMGLQDVDEDTLYRWMARAKEMGLVSMAGSRSTARWFASAEIRKEQAKQAISLPLGKRPVVSYDELWLEEYVPNVTFYLSERQRQSMHARCQPGSAPISAMNQHDLSLFLCGLPYGSSRLEGNRYSFLATVDLIEKGLEMKGASKTETQMILNHHQAVRFLIENIHSPAQDDDVTVTARDIRTIHALLADNLLKDPSMAGRVRNTSVTIMDSAYKPTDMADVIERCLMTIAEKACQIQDPYEQAFFLTVHLPYLQPFVDCNKRTARVACNIPLLRNGVVPMSWMDVEATHFVDGLIAVYELNEPSLLAEVFHDGYMRSIERFQIMRQSKEPDEIVLKYNQEIRQAVRARVLDGEYLVPASVDPSEAAVFQQRVEMELDMVRDMNEATLFKNRLKPGDVHAWIESEKNQTERETG